MGLQPSPGRSTGPVVVKTTGRWAAPAHPDGGSGAEEGLGTGPPIEKSDVVRDVVEQRH